MAQTKKTPSKHVILDGTVERDDLALMLHKELNKSRKDGAKVSYFLDEDDNPSEVVDWVSSGCTILDLAISNRPDGGFPVGKHVELSGLEGTGKSLISAQLISETQKRGGLSVFFDSEFAVDRNFWAALGVNVKDVPYVPFTTLEELFTNLELCIGAFRKANKDRLLTIFVDSVAQASTETEMESEHGINGYNTGKSIIISKAMRKITGLIAKQRILLVFTNQLRYNMQAGFGQEKWIVPGGKALSFACSVRIRLANLGKLRVGEGDLSEVIGMKVQAQVIKNRCGPNYRTATFEIHYDSGVQNLASWLTFMKLHGMITGTKAKYVFKRTNGESIEFNAAKFCDLMATDPALKSEIYSRICDEYIMKYRNADSAIIEDVQETNTENDDITVNAVPENE
jgi:recombination protein RecA